MGGAVTVVIAYPVTGRVKRGCGVTPGELTDLISVFTYTFVTLVPRSNNVLVVATLTSMSPLGMLGCSFCVFKLVVTAYIAVRFKLVSGGG